MYIYIYIYIYVCIYRFKQKINVFHNKNIYLLKWLKKVIELILFIL